MTEEINSLNNNEDTSKKDGVPSQTFEEIQAELATAKAEAAKYRKQKADLVKERDELKLRTKPDPQEENFKELWHAANNKAIAQAEKMKNSDVRAAIISKLPSVGVLPALLEAAVKLVDTSLIDWNEDDGVDGTSVVAAVQKLKKDFPPMFETKVGQRDAKSPADGSSSEKTITRAEYDKLVANDPTAWQAKRKEGYKVV